MDHLETAKRELHAHFGASITPDQINAIIQAVISIISLFRPANVPPPSSVPPQTQGRR